MKEPIPAIDWCLRCIAPLLLPCLLVVPSLSNPLPPGAVFFHVHPWEADFCLDNPITDCDQIVQYSPVEGEVEFDLFLLTTLGPEDPVDSVRLTIVWPEAWHYLLFENCCTGEVETQVLSDRCTIDWTFDPPIQIDPSAPFLLGRLGIDVAGFGGLELYAGWIMSQGYPIDLIGSHALAGVDECFCWTECESFQQACGASMFPERLDLSVEQGGTVEGIVTAYVRWNDPYFPCPVDFVTDEAWISLSVEWIDPQWRAEITVTVDAGDLPVGPHVGSLRAESSCVECVEVLVDVREAASVPDDGPRVLSRTWGELRTSFR